MLTEADKIVNKNVDNSFGDKRFAKFESSGSVSSFDFNTPVVKLDEQPDGQTKVSWIDDLVKDDELVKVAMQFYKDRDGEILETPEAAISYWANDQTWKQANTVSILKRLNYVTGDSIDQSQLERMKFLIQKWDDQPMFFRGPLETLKSNLAKGLVDPVNLAGGIIYGTMAKTVGKKALKKGLNELIKSQIKKRTTGDVVLKNIIKEQSRARLIGSLQGGATVAGIDATAMAGADYAMQLTEMELGLRDRFDPYRTGMMAITGGTVSFAATTGLSYVFSSLGKGISQSKLPKSLSTTISNMQKKNIGIAVKDQKLKGVNRRTVLKSIDDYIQVYGFNKFNEVDRLQKIFTGVGADPFSLKRAYKVRMDGAPDPALLPAFRFKDTLSSSARAQQMLEWRAFLPAAKNSADGQYRITDIDGLNVLLKPYADLGEASDFLVYVAAKRSIDVLNHLKKQKIDLKTIRLPFDEKTAKKFIDYGELSPTDYKLKYNEVSNKKGGNYKLGNKNYLKRFTDFLLDYSFESDIISAETKKKILGVYRNGYVPFYLSKEVAEVFEQTERLITKPAFKRGKVVQPTAPVRKILKGTKLVDLNFYNTLINHTYSTIQGADFNRANLSLIDLLLESQASGKFGTVIGNNGVVARIPTKAIKVKAISDTVSKSLDRLGFRIQRLPGKKGDLPSAFDVAAHSPIFKQDNIDNPIMAVYRAGKPEFYEVKNPFLLAMYKSYGRNTNAYIAKFSESAIGEAVNKVINVPARIIGRAITMDPTFQAANVTRDTLSGTINSVNGIVRRDKDGIARGFIPVFDTIKGYKDQLIQQEAFRTALVNGLGMSTRYETGFLIPKDLTKIIQKSNPSLAKSYLDDLKYFLKEPGTSTFRRYSDFISKFEYATRMGELALAEKSGFSKLGASYTGREVATDFGLHGASRTLNWLSSNIIFLNASLQGFNRGFRRAFRESGKLPGDKGILQDARAGAAALILATVVAPKVYNYYRNSKFKEYQQLDNIHKQLNQVITITDEDGNWKRFAKIPMPYDYGFYGNIAEAFLEYSDTHASGMAQKYIAQSLGLLMPVTHVGPVPLPIPTTLQAFIEAIINKDLFTQSAIKQEFLKSKVTDLQILPRTRNTAIRASNFIKWLTSFGKDPEKVQAPEFLGITFDPITIDFFMSNFLVGIMRYPLDIFENKFMRDIDAYGERGFKRMDEEDLLRKPWSILTKRYIIDGPLKNTQHTQIFYDLIKKAKQLAEIYPERLDIGEDGIRIFTELMKGYDEQLKYTEHGIKKEILFFEAISPTLKTAASLLRDLRDQRDELEFRPDLSGKQKLIERNNFQQAINDLTYELITQIAESDLQFILENMYGKSMFKVSPRIKK